MENWFQYLLLRGRNTVCGATLAAFSLSAAANDSSGLKVNSELFDVSLNTGVINLEDFPASHTWGVGLTFKASEKFFLQYNYLQADISKSSFEENEGGITIDLGDDRAFRHYDLLLGYNLFQGEFFAGEGQAHLSSLYLVGGVGDSDFGEEENFTYTVGVGYQIELHRKYILRFDYRDYIYRSSLLVGDDEETIHNSMLGVGLGYLF